ncbi:MAG: hypothetical protein JWP81_2485 [Ferruginibacter sp.]|nr:hypothetical protein [Ferruginibacter sp.]
MQAFIDRASGIPVLDGAKMLKSTYLSLGLLIDNVNPLAIDSIRAIDSHFSGSVLSKDQINTYLASSVLLHNLDSWAYLSHAIDSLLKGNPGIALHLGYYSELRASMSFLASEGVGIFNHRHICVDKDNAIIANPTIYINRNGRSIKKGAGTHQFVWDSIQKWTDSSIKPADNDILQVFSVKDKSFLEWTTAFPYSASVNARIILKKWLSKWNSDVRFFKNDRDTRNNVSYRPQRLIPGTQLYSLPQVIDILGSFWELMEPDQLNKFQLLDKYLLRVFLQELYSFLPASIKLQESLESVIKRTLSNLGLSHEQSFIDFLNDTSPIQHNLFIEAEKEAIDRSSKAVNALSVIARATLMLRVSTGTSNLLLSKAGIQKDDLAFLFERFGVESGFWNPGSAPTNFDFLWDEIKDHIDDTTTWVSRKNPNLCLSEIYSDEVMPLSLNYFSQFHRAALWGLAK